MVSILEGRLPVPFPWEDFPSWKDKNVGTPLAGPDLQNLPWADCRTSPTGKCRQQPLGGWGAMLTSHLLPSPSPQPELYFASKPSILTPGRLLGEGSVALYPHFTGEGTKVWRC